MDQVTVYIYISKFIPSTSMRGFNLIQIKNKFSPLVTCIWELDGGVVIKRQLDSCVRVGKAIVHTPVGKSNGATFQTCERALNKQNDKIATEQVY